MLHSPEACEEAAAAREQKEGESDHEHVAEVHHGGHKASDFQLGVVVPHGVHKQVSRARPRRQERAPPPNEGSTEATEQQQTARHHRVYVM